MVSVLLRVHRELVSLRVLCERFGVELEEIDEEKLLEILAKIELSNWKLATKNEYRRDLRQLLRMLGNEKLASKIRCKEPKDNELTRDDLLTVDEVLMLVNAAMNERDKAMVMCHLDLGCRPEELLTLRLGDFQRDAWGFKVNIRRSKTYRRSPHLSFSIPYVARWLEAHPLKDSNAPAWIDFNKLRRGIVAPVDNAAYRRIIQRLLKRARINKKFSPYNFRHTSITMWSVVLTEQQLSRRSGHVPGSKSLLTGGY